MRTKQRKLHRYFAGAFALIAAASLLGGCAAEEAAAPELLEPVKLEPDTAVVRYEDIFNLNAAEGCILPTSVTVTFPADGQVETVEVQQGQTVKKGDVLVRMNMEAVEEELEKLTLQKEEAEAVAARTNSSLKMTAEIHRQLLSQLNAAGDTNAAAVKEVDLWEALMAVRHAEENQAAEQQKLQDRMDELQATLDQYSEICAPADGVIGWMLEGDLEDRWVEEEDVLLSICDMSTFYLSTERMSEYTLETADRIWAQIGDQEYDLIPRANVMSEDMADAAEGIALTSKFDFEKQPDGAQLSQEVNALVFCRWQYQQSVLCVPSGAIFRDGEGYYVYLIEDDVMVRTPVQIGERTVLRVQILSGVEEGDVVYVAD